MRKWIVKNAATAAALLAATEAGTCKTEADVEAIAAALGDTVRWCSSEIDPPTPAAAMPFSFPVTVKDFMDFQEQIAVMSRIMRKINLQSLGGKFSRQ